MTYRVFPPTRGTKWTVVGVAADGGGTGGGTGGGGTGGGAGGSGGGTTPGLPVITTTVLPTGTRGSAYSASLGATGAAPISWSILSGSLPPGISLNRTTGALTGAPTATGGYGFTVEARNSLGAVTAQLGISVFGSAAAGSTPSPWTTWLKGR